MKWLNLFGIWFRPNKFHAHLPPAKGHWYIVFLHVVIDHPSVFYMCVLERNCILHMCRLLYDNIVCILVISTSVETETWIVTDGHMINTNCSSSHNRKALCCKMSVEFDTFLGTDKKWVFFCSIYDSCGDV